jgi:hypothetical protein
MILLISIRILFLFMSVRKKGEVFMLGRFIPRAPMR